MSDQQFRPAHSAFDESPEVKEAAALSLAGKRLDRAAAEALYYGASLHTLARLAHAMRLRLHPQPIVTYVGDRNINYSNVCVCACRFCAFFRAPESGEGYVITREEMARKIDETLRLGGTQILLQGGHHPDLPLEWYEDLLRWMRATWPGLHIHAFSPPEIFFWSQKFGLSVDEVISRLRAAGLDSIPGGGAEIFDEEIRARICPDKGSTAEWLAVHEAAHRLGIKTNATILYGHIEGVEHRIDHLDRLRALQDRTGGFNAFIPLKYRNYGNAMSEVGEVSVIEDLRMLAMSRIYLDNIPHVKAYWVMYGKATTELALAFGADDIDGTIDDTTKIYSMAGADDRRPRMTADEMRTIVRHAGLRAVERDTLYNEL